MRVVFSGILEKQTSGCKPCGARKVSKKVMSTKKSYILPSGETKTFYVGRPQDVSEEDGEFLLTYTYTDEHGEKQNVFTEVK